MINDALAYIPSFEKCFPVAFVACAPVFLAQCSVSDSELTLYLICASAAITCIRDALLNEEREVFDAWF
jgi:hypothetical protein